MAKPFRQVLAARTDLLIAFDHENAVLERQIGAESNTAACDWCSGSRTGFASGRYSLQISHRGHGFRPVIPPKRLRNLRGNAAPRPEIALPAGVDRRVNRGFFRRESTTADKIGNGGWLTPHKKYTISIVKQETNGTPRTP